MSIFFRREFYHKVLSLFITLVFLIESTLLPIVTLLPQTASAATTSYTASADFSTTQGQKNWQYLSSSGAQMAFDASNNRWKGNETYPPLLWNNGGHPGSNADAVRRWLAPQAGSIRITGNVRDGDPGGGDGVSVSIRKSGVTLWQQTIANGNTTGFNYDLTASVYAGETIDFVINKIGNDQYDSTAFDPTIVFTDNAPIAPTITISRTPATSQTSPFKVGDWTGFTSVNTPSIFTTNLTGTGYNQIGAGTPRTFTFSTIDLVNNGSCNASTGACNIPGNWDASSFTCPAGVTGTQQMTEWYTVGDITSNKLTWWFQCSATAVPSTQTPIGYLDGIQSDGIAVGWALDPDSSATSISVHFYIDGAAGGGGTFAGSAVANISRPDVNSGTGYPGDHGFNFPIPSQWRDGRAHTLYVHGIDLSGDGSKNVLLSNVPKSFTLGTSVSNNPSLSISPTTFTAGTPFTISVINAVPNGALNTVCFDPNNVVCDDPVTYTTNASGQFTHTYDTTGWTTGTYHGNVKVNGVQSNTVSFTVTPPAQTVPIITPFSPPSGPVGTSVTITGTGFTQTGNKVKFGDLGSENNPSYNLNSPDGRTLVFTVPSSDYFSCWTSAPACGVPAQLTQPGVYQVSVMNANGQSNTAPFTVTATQSGTIAIATTSLPSGVVGTPYSTTIGASGGSSAYTWTISGTLPPGLQFAQLECAAVVGQSCAMAPAGISGTPATAGNYTFTAIVSSGTLTASKVFTVAITPADRPAPTPTTAPMATLTLQRDQEQVQPDQPVSFSGALDSSKVAFPQGSSLVMAISDGVSIDRIEIDGSALATSAFSVNGGSIKIPFSAALYNGSHTFRIVLRNILPVQLDRRVSVWVTAVDAGNTLLLKGRTASTLMAHLPTEVIGKGVSLAVPPLFGWAATFSGIPCCWSSADPTHFSIREFRFGEMDITRGPFFTPNLTPLLPENIAFTLFPGDASMQRVALSLKQFSDPLAKEFITAQYQYILGRDPSGEELSRYLPKFAGWRNPLANLMEVYNRRADVRQAILVPRARNIGGRNDGSPLPSWDKLLEWVAIYGWKEEPSLASFKLQSGFDNGWQLFRELWVKYRERYAESSGNGLSDDEGSDAEANKDKSPVAAIAYLCYTSNLNHNGSQQDRKTSIDFEFCWKNDQMVRHTAILWAKDTGWAYNQIFRENFADGEHGGYFMGFSVITINPDGPILASTFGPGKYPEYTEEQQWRYPPAQLYYDLISSSEYASSIQQRFRTNIDSIIRLFFGRPASEDDIAWAKDKFISGGYKDTLGYSRSYSWITPQWEPNGGLIASNFEYVEDEEFLKNSRFITDDIYGIRHIQGEADAVSSRLIEMIEKYGRQELYQGDNFKRIVSGLYRLYLRRTPTDAEVEERRVSGKNFGGIEFFLNQSAEYGKTPASSDAIRSIYRNYLGRDPNDADIAQWGDRTISSISQSIGNGSEVKSYAQQHPENAYIFPIKEIKIKKCGFFCSIFGKIIGVVLAVASCYFGCPALAVLGIGTVTTTGLAIGAVGLGYLGISTGVSGGANWTGAMRAGSLTNIVLNSISRGFNEAGFNGKTFVSHVSIARAMAGQTGGVFSIANILESADPIILDGFRTMAVAPQAPQGNAFAQAIQQTYPGLASPLAAIVGLFGTKQEVSTRRIAQIDVSSHYGSGAVTPSKGTSSTKGSVGTAGIATAKASFTKTLTQGSRGAEVLKLQKLLGEADLVFLPEYQTGYYGAKTVAAVKRFQKRNGLEQVGFVGAKTRALLNSAR